MRLSCGDEILRPEKGRFGPNRVLKQYFGCEELVLENKIRIEYLVRFFLSYVVPPLVIGFC